MQDEQQYEQLMLIYNQIKNGSEDIRRMIQNEDFDSAISMIKTREELFLNCKCIRKYLELTPVQQNIVNKIVEEIQERELENIKILSKRMQEVQQELKKTQQSEKLQKAYDFENTQQGSIINYEE